MERKLIEEKVLRCALEQIELDQINNPILIVVGENWHPGVIGIVASRLKDRFNRPAIVVALDKNGKKGVGSGRSVHGIDLGANILAANQAGIIEKGGGHKMAAGFSIDASNIKLLARFLNERISKFVESESLCPELHVDGTISVGGVNEAIINEIEKLAPFGSGNPEPMFVLPNVNTGFANTVGEGHVRVSIKRPEGGNLSGIAFRAADRPHGTALLQNLGKPYHIVGKLKMNRWRGSASPQIQIEDLAVPC